MGEIFFHRSSAVFRRRTSDLVHLTICFPRIRSSQRIIARVEWELAIRRKQKQNKNKYLRNFDSISYGSGIKHKICYMLVGPENPLGRAEAGQPGPRGAQFGILPLR